MYVDRDRYWRNQQNLETGYYDNVANRMMKNPAFGVGEFLGKILGGYLKDNYDQRGINKASESLDAAMQKGNQPDRIVEATDPNSYKYGMAQEPQSNRLIDESKYNDPKSYMYGMNNRDNFTPQTAQEEQWNKFSVYNPYSTEGYQQEMLKQPTQIQGKTVDPKGVVSGWMKEQIAQGRPMYQIKQALASRNYDLGEMQKSYTAQKLHNLMYDSNGKPYQMDPYRISLISEVAPTYGKMLTTQWENRGKTNEELYKVGLLRSVYGVLPKGYRLAEGGLSGARGGTGGAGGSYAGVAGGEATDDDVSPVIAWWDRLGKEQRGYYVKEWAEIEKIQRGGGKLTENQIMLLNRKAALQKAQLGVNKTQRISRKDLDNSYKYDMNRVNGSVYEVGDEEKKRDAKEKKKVVKAEATSKESENPVVQGRKYANKVRNTYFSEAPGGINPGYPSTIYSKAKETPVITGTPESETTKEAMKKAIEEYERMLEWLDKNGY